MVLRLVSGPMLEKSNRTGPSANRQKVLLTATLTVSLFSDFQLPEKRGIFKKFLGNLRDSRDSGNSRKIFPEYVFELDYFVFFF